jgi:glycine C-acetyltransferase
VNERLREELAAELDALREAGTYKRFNVLRSPQGPVVEMEGRGDVIVLSSNNYLGLAGHPAVVQAGIEGLERYGAGTASVRFICGTFAAHVELEAELASFSGTEAALTYGSCWNANEAVIPSLTDERTLIVSDELNHASIVDAVRLARPARKFVYRHSDMDELSEGLASCERGQRKLVITDGVFSMEGDLARLPEILELVREHDAVVIVDDSHGTGVLGATGRGLAEHYGLLGEVDVITSTLGKALGGAAGGYVASSREVCDALAQRSRPHLFSNALPPTVCCSALRAVRLLREDPSVMERLRANVAYFRERLQTAGFRPLEGESAIIPIIVGETAFAIRLSARLLDEGVFVTGFGHPVVPEGTARVRVQMSAAHTREHLDRALAAFERVGRELGLLAP